MNTALLSGAVLPAHALELREAGWTVLDGEQYSWETWASGSQNGIPRVWPAAFGAWLRTAVRANDAGLMLIVDGIAPAIRVRDLEVRFWHVLPEVVRAMRADGVIVILQDTDPREHMRYLVCGEEGCGLAREVDAILCEAGAHEPYSRWNPEAILGERDASLIAIAGMVQRKREERARRCCV